MPLYHIMILAIVQGITEFLPVSSSGHLILAHAFFQRGAETVNYWGTSLAMDISVHIGTLLAVLIYFRSDILRMVTGVGDIFLRRTCRTPGAQMVIMLVLSAIPIIIAGLALHVFEPDWARSLTLLAIMMIAFGIILGISDKIGANTKTTDTMTLRDAMIIGLAQTISLIPGVSRSGITMTTARFLGFSRVEAARFSFFMAIIATAGAGTLGLTDLSNHPTPGMVQDFVAGIILSCLTAIAAMHLLLKWLQRASFMIFVWYRIILGVLLLILLQTGVIT
jgi:undecaprenyl-diphosphatase